MGLILKQPEIQAVISQKKERQTADLASRAERAAIWRINYRAQCAHFIGLVNQSNTNPDTLKKAAEDTLEIATQMDALYDALNETVLHAAVRKDKILLQQMLGLPIDRPPHNNSTLPDTVQEITHHSDTTRLLAGYVRRGCIALTIFPDTFGHNLSALKTFADVTSPFISLLGFLVYLPRTILSSLALGKRAFEDQTLPLKARIQAHCEIDNRLFNIVSDIPTIIGGFITCFLLTSATLFVAAYIAVAVKLFDVIASMIRAAVDTRRLNAFRAEYESLIATDDSSKEAQAFLNTLNAQIEHESKASYLICSTHIGLLLALLAFIPPVIMLSPVIPITAAIFATVLIFLRLPEFRQLFLPKAPETNLETISEFSIFNTKASAEDKTFHPLTAPNDLTIPEAPVSI